LPQKGTENRVKATKRYRYCHKKVLKSVKATKRYQRYKWAFLAIKRGKEGIKLKATKRYRDKMGISRGKSPQKVFLK
jgi:hypothetical protein